MDQQTIEPARDHVVFYPGPDGAPAFRRLASLDEAVRFVEHLRNVEGVGEVSVHALTEVPLAFRAYYRVELPTQSPAAAWPEPAAVAPEPAEAAEAVAEDVEPAAEEADGADGTGKRGLAFFAH